MFVLLVCISGTYSIRTNDLFTPRLTIFSASPSNSAVRGSRNCLLPHSPYVSRTLLLRGKRLQSTVDATLAPLFRRSKSLALAQFVSTLRITKQFHNAYTKFSNMC